MARSVLIVDDSFIMRTVLQEIVQSDPELSVVGFAENGVVGLEQVRALKPEVILLDLEMPEMDGIAMLKRLALISPAKVVVVSSLGQAGSPQAVEARRLGAAEVVAKPSGAMSLDLAAKRGHEIVRAVRGALGLADA